VAKGANKQSGGGQRCKLKAGEGQVPAFDSLPELVTPEEAARFLRVSQHGIYNLLRSGDLPSIRFGRLFRIRRSVLIGDPQ